MFLVFLTSCDITAPEDIGRLQFSYPFYSEEGEAVKIIVKDSYNSDIFIFNTKAYSNGFFWFVWTGTKNNGEKVPAGVYFFELYRDEKFVERITIVVVF
jgi:flagellar hook assembly protein FlgD